MNQFFCVQYLPPQSRVLWSVHNSIVQGILSETTSFAAVSIERWHRYVLLGHRHCLRWIPRGNCVSCCCWWLWTVTIAGPIGRDGTSGAWRSLGIDVHFDQAVGCWGRGRGWSKWCHLLTIDLKCLINLTLLYSYFVCIINFFILILFYRQIFNFYCTKPKYKGILS